MSVLGRATEIQFKGGQIETANVGEICCVGNSLQGVLISALELLIYFRQ